MTDVLRRRQSPMLLCVPAQAQAQSLAANRVWGAETALPVVAQPAPGAAPPREPADGYLSAVPVPAPKDQLRKARTHHPWRSTAHANNSSHLD